MCPSRLLWDCIMTHQHKRIVGQGYGTVSRLLVCFDCQYTARACSSDYGNKPRRCPHCQGKLDNCGKWFRVPKKRKRKAWERLRDRVYAARRHRAYQDHYVRLVPGKLYRMGSCSGCAKAPPSMESGFVPCRLGRWHIRCPVCRMDGFLDSGEKLTEC